MKQNHMLRTLLVTAAMALSLPGLARADMPAENPVATTAWGQGLLGQTYAALDYSYIDLPHTSASADRFRFAFNQPLNYNFDGVLTYDWTQNGIVAGSRLRTQTVLGALRAFSQTDRWGKPYVEGGVGYAWQRGAATSSGTDNSVVWEVAGGVELQVANAVTVTPFIQYQDAPHLAGSGTWNFGVKGNYWIGREWAITGGLARDNHRDTTLTIGTSFHY